MKSKQKILYLRSDICSEPVVAGGSVSHTLGVIDGFLQLGFEIVCASSAMKTILQKKQIVFQPLRVYPWFFFLRWKLGYMRWRLESLCSTLWFFVQTYALCKRHKPWVIYQRYTLLNATGAWLSRWFSIPLILEYNGSDVWQFDQLAPHKWFKFNKLAFYIEHYNLRKADYIIVVSQALYDELVNRGVSSYKILVNPNGVDEAVFSSDRLINERNALRKKFDLESRYVFGFVGTFSFWHGIELITDIIPLIISKAPRARFLLIGDGPRKVMLYKALKKQIDAGFVVLPGMIEKDSVPSYLSMCDAFLCPTQPNADGTRFFGSPTKLFEYMSMAKPIIASDIEQLSDIVAPALRIDRAGKLLGNIRKSVGILVHPYNVAGFVKAACLCVDCSVDEQKYVGDIMRKTVLQAYTWRLHVQRIVQHVAILCENI